MSSNNFNVEKRRRRRSSSLMYSEPPESLEHISDQAVLPNLNSEWVNAKGTRYYRHGRAWNLLLIAWQVLGLSISS